MLGWNAWSSAKRLVLPLGQDKAFPSHSEGIWVVELLLGWVESEKESTDTSVETEVCFLFKSCVSKKCSMEEGMGNR